MIFTEGFCKSFDGTKLFCRVKGSGQPILMIHGAVVDSDFFESTAALFAENYKIVTYDRRGYSRSGGNSCEDFYETSAKDALTVMDNFCPGEKYIIIAHSAGALIASKLAKFYPEKINLVVLHEPPLVSYLEPNCEDEEKIKRISAFLDKERFVRAGREFLMLVAENSDVQTEKPSETLIREEQNLRFFLEHEFNKVFSREDIVSLSAFSDFVVCAGKDHPKSFLYKVVKNFSEEFDLPFFEVSGKHNSAFEIPEIFHREIDAIVKSRLTKS